MSVGEASKIEEVRYDPEKLESIYKSEGYQVRFERIWSFVKLERFRMIRKYI